MDKLEIKRALLNNKPSILYRTVETNVFPDRINFYRFVRQTTGACYDFFPPQVL